MEALTDEQTHTKTVKLANSLLQTIHRESSRQKKVLHMILYLFFLKTKFILVKDYDILPVWG